MNVTIIPATILITSFVSCFFAYAHAIEFALWLGVIASFVFAALGILRSHRETEWLLIVVAFTISMRMPSFFQTYPWGFAAPMTDSAFDLTLSNLIRESGKWNPGMGFEVIKGYSYYPILHILTAITSSVTGMDTTLLARIFPFFAEPLVVIFFYMSLRKILSKEVAIWSSLIYNLNGNWHFWEYFIREFIALVFFSMCLYLVLRMYTSREGQRKFFVLGIIAAFMTVSSHHWTSYNLLVILFVLAVFPTMYARIHAWLMNLRIHRIHQASKDHKHLIMPSFLAIVFAMTFSWALHIGYSLFTVHSQNFLGFLINVVSPSPNFVEHPTMRLGFDTKILLYSGYLILGFLGVIELVRRFFERQKTYDDSIFESWFVFSAVYIFAATFLLPSGGRWWTISWRSWGFAFFGLAPLVAIAITRYKKLKSKSTLHFKWLSSWKRLLPLILVFPLVSAVLTAPSEILKPDYPRVDYSFYETALWVKHYLPNQRIALDRWSRSVVIPNGRAVTFEALRWPGGETTFLNTIYQYENFSSALSPAWQIVIFNKRISEWIPSASANSSILDPHYNRVHDSKSLAIYVIVAHD